MLDFECPYCGTKNKIELEDLPDRACDEMDFECKHCKSDMKIGWAPEIEIRSITIESGDIDA